MLVLQTGPQAGQLRNCGSVLGRNSILLSSPNCLAKLQFLPIILFGGFLAALSQGVKVTRL